MQAPSDERYIYNKYVCDEMTVKPDSIATDRSSLDLAWTKLLDHDNPRSKSAQVIIKMNDDDTARVSPNTTNETLGMKKSASWIGSFHNQMRSSFKALTESPGPITRYRQTRFSSRRVRKRVVFKHGDCNVVQGNVAKRRRKYLQDIFTTLVDVKWRWTILVFSMSFIGTWAGFGVIWWLIAYAHGDLDHTPEEIANKTFNPCVTEIKSVATAFLFSVETQHTIGYGVRYMTEECPEAIFIMCIQCILGVLIEAFMVGIVFAKLSRPKKRAQTLLFSRNAVICHRDGIPCLMFRVADMRRSHIIEAHVRAQIIRKKVTKEGEVLPFYQQELKIGADGVEDRLMFIWPTTIMHKIDRQSPLYALSAQDMLKERFEIVVMLEGVVESTGMTTQARSSYLPTEILWGHRFENLISFRKDTAEYEVNYELFNNTYEIDTPLCSAKQLDEVRAELHLPNGLERLCSAGIIPRVSSTVSLDPSDESVESTGRLQMRSTSIPNSASFDSNLFLNNNTTAAATTTNEKTSFKKKWLPTPRRLSVKAEQLPNDSIC